MNEAIREWAHYAKQSLDDRTRELIAMARFDLYYGPCTDEGFPGFATATREIATVIEPLLCEASIDDEETGEPIAIDRRTAKRALLGELAEYL